MANLLNNPVYTTADDVRDTTTIADLKLATDDVINWLITQAQYAIDNYIMHYKCPCVDGQPFMFPTGSSGTCDVIPTDIQLATIKTVEYLYLKGQKSVVELEGRQASSESNLSRSITFTEGGDFNSNEWGLPVDVIPYLDRYKSDFYLQAL